MRRTVTHRFCLSVLLLLAAIAPAAGSRNVPEYAPPVLLSKGGDKPKWKNLKQLKEYAAKGDPQACFELGERFLYGDEVPPDTKQAITLLEKAADGGIDNAWFRLGKIHHDGANGAPDYARALDCYTRAARAGVPEAQHNLGAMLVSARGVKRDYVEGLAWLIVATKSGAVSEAEIQVRERLARRPADIKAAEARAAELLGNLPAAEVRAVLKPSPQSAPASRALPPPVVAPLAKPPVTPLPLDTKAPAPIAPPPVALPSLPAPEKK